VHGCRDFYKNTDIRFEVGLSKTVEIWSDNFRRKSIESNPIERNEVQGMTMF
jgi:hypothetical protein